MRVGIEVGSGGVGAREPGGARPRAARLPGLAAGFTPPPLKTESPPTSPISVFRDPWSRVSPWSYFCDVRRHAHLCSGAGHALKPAALHLYLHLTYSAG